MNYVQLGRNIKHCRQSMNLTQEGLARRIHISSSYMTMIENGTRNVSLDVLTSLAKELHVPLDYLVFADYPDAMKDLGIILALYRRLKKHSPKELKELYKVLSALSEILEEKV